MAYSAPSCDAEFKYNIRVGHQYDGNEVTDTLRRPFFAIENC